MKLGAWRASFLALSVLSIAAQGCLLVEPIEFPQTILDNPNAKLGAVYSTGALPFKGACGVSDESGVRIQFAMTTSTQPALPIREGTRLPGFEVNVPDSFNARSVEFATLAESPANRAVIYPAPDIACATDIDCSNGMLCDLRARAQTSGDTTRVCQLKTTLGQITSRPLAETRPPTPFSHEVLILFSNGSTILGANPNGTSNPDRQSDPDESRTSSAYYLTSRLATLANLPNGLDESVKVCVGYFNEPSGLTLKLLPAGSTPDTCFNRVDGDVVNDIQRLNPVVDGLFTAVQSTSQQGPRSNYGALISGASILGSATNSLKKHIILVTDGRDDGSNPDTESFDVAVSALLSNGVQVHVLQLDYPGDGGLRSPAGPIDHLAQIACKAGGSYQYLSSPTDFENAYSAIANNIAGGFELGVVVGGLAGLPAGTYRVATTMAVTLGDASANKGVKSVDFAYSADGDNRLTLFKRGPEFCAAGDPADNCLCVEGLNDCLACTASGEAEPALCGP
jgi:hypothetical protein